MRWKRGSPGLKDRRPSSPGRVLPFDGASALAWAVLMAQGRREGRPRSALDMIVAAVAEVHGCLVVTDNERDFAGLPYLNPVRDIEPPRPD